MRVCVLVAFAIAESVHIPGKRNGSDLCIKFYMVPAFAIEVSFALGHLFPQHTNPPMLSFFSLTYLCFS